MNMAAASIIDGNPVDIANRAMLTGHYEGIPDLRKGSNVTETVTSTTVIQDDSSSKELKRLRKENKRLTAENTRLSAECDRLSKLVDSFTYPK